MKKYLFILSLLAMLLLPACSNIQIGWVEMNFGNTFRATYYYFDGRETEAIPLDAGQTFSLTYDVMVDGGTLSLQISDPNGNVLWEETFLQDTLDNFQFSPPLSGIFNLSVIGDKTEGEFDLTWEIND